MPESILLYQDPFFIDRLRSVGPTQAALGKLMPNQVALEDAGSATAHFEDNGKSLATDSNDRKVISHTVDVQKKELRRARA
ncbi:hypothetical protein [Paraburkholderia aspalathi]|uniref:hypothetical protein n=1 Tax=Paraburkholderia aspalathi TaxID=1324617 RepID=UPI0038BA308B